MKIKLDAGIYPIEAIINAAYAFINRAYIYLDSDDMQKHILVSIKEKKRRSAAKGKVLKGEFLNELLHCALRNTVSKNNKKIREYIIGCALNSAMPLSGSNKEAVEFGYQRDPLGIAIPWEEKYGRNKHADKV